MSETGPAITVAEQAEAAGKPRADADPIAELRDHCMRVIDAHAQSHNRPFALTSLGQMLYWIGAR